MDIKTKYNIDDIVAVKDKELYSRRVRVISINICIRKKMSGLDYAILYTCISDDEDKVAFCVYEEDVFEYGNGCPYWARCEDRFCPDCGT